MCGKVILIVQSQPKHQDGIGKGLGATLADSTLFEQQKSDLQSHLGRVRNKINLPFSCLFTLS